MSRALPRVVATSARVVLASSAQMRERPRGGGTTRLPCVLTAALVGLVFLAPSPVRATTTSDSDRQDKQGLMWPVQGKVTSRFGPRGFFHVHRGVDIKAPRGTPVHAAAAGTVAFSGRQSSYGRVIKIDHPNGLRTIYAHNSSNFVTVGERVKARGRSSAPSDRPDAPPPIICTSRSGATMWREIPCRCSTRDRGESPVARVYERPRSPTVIRARVTASSAMVSSGRGSLLMVGRRSFTRVEDRRTATPVRASPHTARTRPSPSVTGTSEPGRYPERPAG